MTIYARKGTIVTDFSMDLVSWLYEVRKLNEPFIFRNACRYLHISWIERMYEEFTTFSKENASSQDIDRTKYITLDNELHQTVIKTCQNTFLRNMMTCVNDHSHRLRIKTSKANQEYSKSIQEHLNILEAFKEKNPAKVEKAALEHVLEARAIAFKYY